MELTELRELLAAATPGRWTYGWDGVGGNYFIPEIRRDSNVECCSPHGTSMADEADAALIVALRNQGEALLEIAEAATDPTLVILESHPDAEPVVNAAMERAARRFRAALASLAGVPSAADTAKETT